MLALIPKHKGTDHMQADLKHRLAQLRQEQVGRPRRRQASGAGLQDREGRRRPGDPARRAERRQVAIAQVAHERRRRRGRIPLHDAGPAAGHGALRGHPDPTGGHARRDGGLFRGLAAGPRAPGGRRAARRGPRRRRAARRAGGRHPPAGDGESLPRPGCARRRRGGTPHVPADGDRRQQDGPARRGGPARRAAGVLLGAGSRSGRSPARWATDSRRCRRGSSISCG